MEKLHFLLYCIPSNISKSQNFQDSEFIRTRLSSDNLNTGMYCLQVKINKCFMSIIIKNNFCSWLLVPSTHMYKKITTTISTIFFVIPIPIYCHHHHQIVKDLGHLFTNCSFSCFIFHTHLLVPMCYNEPISVIKFCLI